MIENEIYGNPFCGECQCHHIMGQHVLPKPDTNPTTADRARYLQQALNAPRKADRAWQDKRDLDEITAVLKAERLAAHLEAQRAILSRLSNREPRLDAWLEHKLLVRSTLLSLPE